MKNPAIEISHRDQQQLRRWAREDRTSDEQVLRIMFTRERLRRKKRRDLEAGSSRNPWSP